VSPVDTSSSLDDIEDEELRSQQNKRGLLPPHATHILKSWLFQHMLVCMPLELPRNRGKTCGNVIILQADIYDDVMNM